MTQQVTPGSNAEKLRQLYEILASGRVEQLGEVMAEDVVSEYPQSGERLVGVKNIGDMIANYPGGPLDMNAEMEIVAGDEEHYMLTPTFNVVRVQGSGDTLVGTQRAKYPDGTVWWIISVVHFHEGRIVRAQQFFAPEFEAPEWRKKYAEQIPSAPTS